MAKISIDAIKPVRSVKNTVQNIADQILWNTPLTRSQRDAIAILNPTLAGKKKYTPKYTRGEYRRASAITESNPITAYKQKRQNAVGTSLASGVIAGLGALGAKSYADMQNAKEQEQRRVAREQKAQEDNKYQQRYESDREWNTKVKQKWQDESFGRYKLKNPVSGGTAVASALQNVSQKIKNRMHPDKGMYVTEAGVVRPASERVRSALQDPFNPENVYNFNAMMANIPQDSTDEYTMVSSGGVGKPIARITATTKRPKVTVDPSMIGSITNNPDVSNMSLAELKKLAEAFNSFMGAQSGNRFQQLEFVKPVNPQAPNKGSATAKRMTKGKQMTNNAITKRQRRRPIFPPPPPWLFASRPYAVSQRTGLSEDYLKQLKKTNPKMYSSIANPFAFDYIRAKNSKTPLRGVYGGSSVSTASDINLQAPNKGSATAKRMTRKTDKYGTTVRKADSQRNPAYVRLPKAPATSDANTRRLAQRNRIQSAIDAFMENPGRAMLNAITPERKKVQRLKADMMETYMKNPEFYNKIRQGYFDSANKGYIRGKNMPTR